MLKRVALLILGACRDPCFDRIDLRLRKWSARRHLLATRGCDQLEQETLLWMTCGNNGTVIVTLNDSSIAFKIHHGAGLWCHMALNAFRSKDRLNLLVANRLCFRRGGAGKCRKATDSDEHGA